MSDTRIALGAQGEALAARYLEARGYRILARNARAEGVELDLVAETRSLLVVVEVKTRRSRRAGMPEEAVDARKQARLVRGALAWRAAQPQRFAGLRFDVIACQATPDGSWTLRHWPAAFDAGE